MRSLRFAVVAASGRSDAAIGKSIHIKNTRERQNNVLRIPKKRSARCFLEFGLCLECDCGGKPGYAKGNAGLSHLYSFGIQTHWKELKMRLAEIPCTVPREEKQRRVKYRWYW